MVCISCIVIPVLIWVYHKYIQPFVLRFWNPYGKKSIKDDEIPKDIDENDPQFKYILERKKTNPVMLFSKPTCSFCKMAKEVLDGVGVEYTVEEIDQREDCDKLQDMFAKLTGERTVPRIFIGGKSVGGSSDLWSLHNQGTLEPMLKEAGATFTSSDKKEN